MLFVLKEYSKRQQALDVSTAPSAGECKTKRVEPAGVEAKEIMCKASSCFHEFSSLRLLFCLTFFVLLCLRKRCKRLGDRSRCLALKRIFGTFELQQQHIGSCGSFPRVSSRARCLHFCAVLISPDLGFGAHTDVPEGWKRQLFRCTRRLPERGFQGRPGQRQS